MAFPTTLDSDFGTIVDSSDYPEAAHVNTLRRAVEGLEAKVGINSSNVKSSIDYKVNNFFTSTRKLYLYENTAPTGWTIDSVTDKVLAVKGGSIYATGGVTAGTWTQPSHTLTLAESPAHSHNLVTDGTGSIGNLSQYARAWNAYPYSFYYDAGRATKTYTAGGGSPHNHGTIYRPYAAVGIIVYNGNFI